MHLQEVLDPPAIAPSTKFQLSLAFPDFSQFKVQDLFSGLGPVSVFSAKHHWSVPRTVKLKKTDTEGFGFSVRGDAPVVVAGVDRKSLAEVSMKHQINSPTDMCIEYPFAYGVSQNRLESSCHGNYLSETGPGLPIHSFTLPFLLHLCRYVWLRKKIMVKGMTERLVLKV